MPKNIKFPTYYFGNVYRRSRKRFTLHHSRDTRVYRTIPRRFLRMVRNLRSQIIAVSLANNSAFTPVVRRFKYLKQSLNWATVYFDNFDNFSIIFPSQYGNVTCLCIKLTGHEQTRSRTIAASQRVNWRMNSQLHLITIIMPIVFTVIPLLRYCRQK